MQPQRDPGRRHGAGQDDNYSHIPVGVNEFRRGQQGHCDCALGTD